VALLVDEKTGLTLKKMNGNNFPQGGWLMKIGAILFFLASFLFVPGASAQDCVDCHKKVTPGIVSDWRLSKHGRVKFPCSICHGDEHRSAEDVAKVKIPTVDTCANCHGTLVGEFKSGKHALAWAAMKAMPTFHW
jgi:hypothetical protein